MNDTQQNTMPETPLTNWKNPPTIQDVKQDLQDAQPSHGVQKTKIAEWLDNLNITGKAKIVASANRSAVQPKLIRKQAEWRYAALTEPFLSTDDVFNVTPVTWEDKKAAEQNQLVLNHQFNTKLNKQKFIDEYVRTAVDEGTVIVRVGWEFQEKEITEQVPVMGLVPDPQTGLPIAGITGYREQKRMKTVVNKPTVEVCNSNNVIIDPSAQGDIEKAGFVIYSFESSKSKLKKDGKYKNIDKINLSANSILGTPDHTPSAGTQNFNFKDDARKKFVVHEYWGFWDIHGTGLVEPIVMAWVGDVVIRLELNPYPDQKLPFVIEQYLPVRKSMYGEPDGALLEDNQKIIGAVTRGMIDIMGKSANGQTGIRKDMLDATNKRKFDRGQDYEFNVNVDPRQGVHMHTYPEIPNSAQFMLQLQNQEAESLTGVKSFSQGISGQTLGDVAAGVRGALDAASKRELGILRRLSNGIVSIGKKIIAMNGEFLSEEEVIRITEEEFVTVRRDDLQGEFDLKLSISTAEEDNNKAQELAFMLQTIGNNMDPGMSRMILADIAKLRKMPELAKRISEYQPQPDPMMQQKLQLEIQLLTAQIENEKAQAQERLANAQLHSTKGGTEQVKQSHIQSDTDLKNLKFVEQESGVEQERKRQLQRDNASNQVEHRMMDHVLQTDLAHTQAKLAPSNSQ